MKQKQIIEKINKTKSWPFKDINTIDKHLARLIMKKKKPTDTLPIPEMKDYSTTDGAYTKNEIKEYYEQLYVSKLDDIWNG